ncbi:MAG TPA: hypothetical protein VND22_03465 [Actinomycetota bacterium]|nr:hypothetical protein [Actinomycetota bacterium]
MRRMLSTNLREGDGIYSEEQRFFIILPTDIAGAKAAFDRLGPLITGIGGVAHIRPLGSDHLVDSVYRRAYARILPVQARWG